MVSFAPIAPKSVGQLWISRAGILPKLAERIFRHCLTSH